MTAASRTIADEEVATKADHDRKNWLWVARRTWAESGEDNVALLAGGVAFNAFLALVPLLTAVVLVYGLVASPADVARHIARLATVLPQEAAALVGDQLEAIAGHSRSATGWGLALSLAISVFGGLRGATGIIAGLNVVYGLADGRPFLHRIGVALVITGGLVLTFILAALAVAAVNLLSQLLPASPALQALLQAAFWLLAAAGVCMVIALIYANAPAREDYSWRWLTPGSLVATLVWIAATLGFSFYVANFGSYNATYGALGAVIVFLTWLYLSSYVVLLGGELNQVLERHSHE